MGNTNNVRFRMDNVIDIIGKPVVFEDDVVGKVTAVKDGYDEAIVDSDIVAQLLKSDKLHITVTVERKI